MLVDDLKRRLAQAMKENDGVAKDILRLALGEMQTAEARANRAPTDDEAAAIVRKLVKSNEETLALATEATQKQTLEAEIALLRALLPATMTVDEIVAALASVADAIKSARNDGQATGVAMKHVKAAALRADGADVTAAVKRIRA